MRRLLGAITLILFTVLGSVAPASADEVTLRDSWPREGSVLWVPPREGNLEFSGPVASSSLELELTDASGNPVPKRTLERLTSEQFATKLLFRIPALNPGEYRVVWSVDTETGSSIDGVVAFTVDEPLIAAGGQNHRHGENAHLYKDSIGEFTLRLLGLVPLFLLAFSYLRSRRRGEGARLDRFAVRVGGVLVVAAGLVQAIADVVAYVEEYHDYPLSAALAAPAVGVFPVALLLGGFLAVVAPLDRRLLGAIALLVAVNAGLGHLTAGWWAVLLYALFMFAMGAFVLLGGAAFGAFVDAVKGRRSDASAKVRGSAVAWLVLGVSSLGMLVLHAKGFYLQRDFRDDLMFRLGVMAASAVTLVMGAFFATRKALLLRLVSLLPLLVLVVLAAAFLWMPPPAAGL